MYVPNGIAGHLLLLNVKPYRNLLSRRIQDIGHRTAFVSQDICIKRRRHLAEALPEACKLMHEGLSWVVVGRIAAERTALDRMGIHSSSMLISIGPYSGPRLKVAGRTDEQGMSGSKETAAQ